MKKIIYEEKEIAVPENINGKKLKSTLGIKKNRAAYLTDLDGNSSLISDGKNIYIRENNMRAGDLPQTEKG